MTVFICDPGLSTRGSHHFHWNLEVARELSRHGMSTKIFGHNQTDQEVARLSGAIPHFAHSTYDRQDWSIPFNEERNWLLGNESFKQDLERLNGEIARPDVTVVVPAVTQHQIDGLARWFAALVPEQRPKLAISLMFAPQWTPWGDRAVRGPEFYARAIKRLQPWLGQSVLLFTETAELSRYYGDLANTQVAVAPTPWSRFGSFAPLRADGGVRFGYFGHSRKERGFHLLPSAISICQHQRLPANFVVHIQHNGYEPETVAADQALRHNPDVSTILASLDVEHYHRALNQCDAILLPYDPAMYRWRGSGLFAEAVMYGKPMVVTSGTAMEASARRGECVAKMCRFSPGDLARAIADVCANVDEMAAEAKIKARQWSDNNSVRVFCQKILAFASPPAVTFAGGDQAMNLENESDVELPCWPVLSPGEFRNVEVRMSTHNSVAVQFTPDRLRLSRGLLVEAELDPRNRKVASATLSLTLNGHELSSLTITAKRQTHKVSGPYMFLGNGLPAVLNLRTSFHDDEPGEAAIMVHRFCFMPRSWFGHRH